MESRDTLLAILAILCVSVLVCGCIGGEQPSTEAADATSESESDVATDSTASGEGSPSPDRYVEINLLDGTKVGGKYVTETAAFTTIIVMYTMDPEATVKDVNGKVYKDPEKYFVKGDGREISLKNSLINSMVTIDDPTAAIEAAQLEMDAIAAAIDNAAEDKPKPIVRDVSFYLGRDEFEISEGSLTGTIGSYSYNTRVGISPSGAEATQVTKIDKEDSGLLVVDIKTYLTEEGRPADITKAVEDTINGAEEYIPTNHNINKIGSYEATLSSGETVDVYIWEAPSNELYKGRADVACFMPDDSTIVLVVASLSDQTVERFFETLEIGDIPQS